MPTFAAVDIGANSVRLKIARLVRHRLQVIHEDREVTRLGESVFRNGTLDPHAMAHTVKVLQRFHRTAQGLGADTVRVVATSALRDTRNSRPFLDWVHSATGWRVEVISGLEEGRLIHLGVLSRTRTAKSRVLLIDLGGGSCELTVSVAGHIKDMVSLPIGAVRLTQEFLLHDPPKKKELEPLRGFIGREIGRVVRRIHAARVQLAIATSGTPAALAALWAARAKKAGIASPNVVPRAAVVKLAKELSGYPLAQRKALEGIGPRRAEIIIAGAVVFAELMTHCNLRSFRYSPLGLRDGLLEQMAADYDRRTQAGRQIESERHDALLKTMRHYRVDMAFAEQTRVLALELFRRLKKVHQLPPEYAEWLQAAAMVQEVGSFINRAGRRRHTYYIVAHSELFGFTTLQRQIIASITRYVGKSRPRPTDGIMSNLPLEEHANIPKAVMLLRLARALDQGRRGSVTGLRARVQDEKVTLQLSTKRGGADLELWALEKEQAYFREVFGRELAATLS